MNDLSKRIAYVINIDFTLDSRAQKEVLALLNAGYEIIICAWNKDKEGKKTSEVMEFYGYEIPITYINKKVVHLGGIKSNFKVLVGYEKALFLWLVNNRDKYDFIHACDMDAAYIPSRLASILNKKLIYDVYDDYPDTHNSSNTVYRLLRCLDKGVIKRSHATIICSEKRKEQISYIPRRLEIIHNSPDLEIIDNTKIISEISNNMKIAYVGNLTDTRMIKELLEIVSRHKEFELHIGGSGDLADAIENKARECDNIFYYGKMKYDRVLSLEKQCDVIPALYDPEFKNHKYAAPNKFYEAMALGKVCIMAHNTGMDKLVEKYETGMTIDFNAEDLELSLVEISRNLEQWRCKEKTIVKVFEDNYSWKVMKRRLLALYDTLGEKS